ncbi:MAG TPA: GTP 3',8-cyclase MoaA [Chloroflexota bacterium]|nr:GTP 3',8-cyclase MoaA [Chloroflexota bacterium]
MVIASRTLLEPLIDIFGRSMGDLRISLTDRCNFRCVYCMPEENMTWIKNEKILTQDEIVRLAGIFVRLGIREIRLTGGEPTLRAGLPDIIRRMNQLKSDGLDAVSLTTNGFRLEQMAGELADAGLTRINVSLDSLVRERFHQLTRRDCLDKVLAGLEELEKHPTISPIKVNAVAIKGFTEDEIIDFARLARRKPYIIRFIEFMPLDADGNWRREQVLAGNEILRVINESFMPLVKVPTDPSSTSRVYRFADGVGEIGFINPVSEPFCSTCNRIRLTADGQLRTCLFSIDETNLRTAMRDGASDDDLVRLIRQAVWAKEKKHRINEGPAFQRASRSMSQIGG